MTDAANYEYDLFISYNHVDEAWAARLAARVEQEDWQGRKLRVFFAPWDILPGQSIPERLEQALPRSRKVGLILSPEAMNSEWVKIERLVTSYIDISERQARLIPLFRRACDIPPFLKPILSIDFREDSHFEDGLRRLITVLKGEPMPRTAGDGRAVVSSAPPASAPSPPADAGGIHVAQGAKIRGSIIHGDITGVQITGAGVLPEIGEPVHVLGESEITDSEIGDITGVKIEAKPPGETP